MKKIPFDNFTVSNLLEHPVWYFLPDDTDLLTPMFEAEQEEDYEIIVRTNFIDNNLQKFSGYIYWGEPQKIEYLKPVVFFGEDKNLRFSFWNGQFTPKEEDIELLVSKCKLPIRFQSIHIYNFYKMEGLLEGIYYLTNKNSVSYMK